MKTLEDLKKELSKELGFSCVGSQMLFAEELAKKFYFQNIKEAIENAFNAGLRYGIYCQGGSYDKSDDIDLEEYLSEFSNPNN